MIRSILVPLSGPTLRLEPLEAAFALAGRFDAYIDAYHPALDPAASAAYLGEGTTGALIETVVEAAEEESGRRLQAAHAAYEERAGRAGLPAGRARFLSERGRDTELVVARARTSDLIVVSQVGVRTDPSLAAVWEALLYESGRPVLLIPPERSVERLTEPGTVLIAWTDSPEAARAVGFAAPFLEQAKRVVIVPVSGHRVEGLIEYVGRHGAKAEALPLLRTERALEDMTGDAILRLSRQEQADMIVMGAFTHGRLRRFVMGGVTRPIVDHCTIPVLMAH